MTEDNFNRLPLQQPDNPSTDPEFWEGIDALLGDEGTPQVSPEEAEAQRRREEAMIMDQAFRQVTGAKEPEQDLFWREKKDRFPDILARNKKGLLLGLFAALLIMMLCIIGIVSFGSAADPYDGRILNNVIVGGIDVGGMTRSEATAAVNQATGHTYTREDMVVVLPDSTLYLSPKDTGAKLNVKEIVEAAYQYGRVGTEAERSAAYQASATEKHIIGLLPYLELDREAIRQRLEDYSRSFASIYTPSSYRLEGEMPALDPDHFDPDAPCQTLHITLGTPGLGVDVDKLYNDILDAYSFNRFRVEVTSVDADAVPEKPDVDAIYEELYIAPQNAAVNMQTFETIPCVYGYGFDLELARELVNGAKDGETVSIPMTYVLPEVTEENLLFQDVLGSCDTPHSANEKRTANLELVCKILNGVVLNPGERFSYNEVVGERTKERGFQAAPAYSGTKLVDSIGGGVCQGSTTLYNACLLADMEILERVNHGFPVNYVPKGLDATVNWGGPDFAFRNTSNYPIQIHAEVSDGYVRMKILGTEERDYYVKMESQVTGVTEPTIEYQEYTSDSGYEDGKVLQGGTTGYYVRSYKCKYSRETDELISREPETYSSYMMKPKIIVVIVDPKPTDPVAPPEEGGEE